MTDQITTTAELVQTIRAAVERDRRRGGKMPGDPELQYHAPEWLTALCDQVESQRCAPTEEEVRQAIGNGWFEGFDEGGKYGPQFSSGDAAMSVIALYAAQPTVREAKAEGWDEGVAITLNRAVRQDDGITLKLEYLNGTPIPNPYRSEADHG